MERRSRKWATVIVLPLASETRGVAMGDRLAFTISHAVVLGRGRCRSLTAGGTLVPARPLPPVLGSRPL